LPIATLSACAAISHAVIATADAAMPARPPASSPIRATHGANAITPSVADHENASISPQVAAMAPAATNVTKWRRWSTTAPRSLRSEAGLIAASIDVRPEDTDPRVGASEGHCGVLAADVVDDRRQWLGERPI